jgi:hypothetical protein
MAKKQTEQDKIEEFLKLARKRLKKEQQLDNSNRREAIEDLKFRHGEGHWSNDQKSQRKAWGGSTLTVNLLPSFVDQVAGEMRQLRPRADVRPTDSKGTPQIAKVRKGIIWDTEYQSDAEVIYDYAGEMMTTCGYGAWQVKTKYTEDNPFLQEMYMELIPNPFVVYLEQRKSVVYQDSRYGFIIDKVPKDEFEELYPDANLPESGVLIEMSAIGMEHEGWFDKDTITVAEYFVVDYEDQECVLFKDGSVLERKDADEKIADWEKLNKEQKKAKQTLEAKIREQVNKQIQTQPPQQPVTPEQIEAFIQQSVTAMLPPLPEKPEISDTKKLKKNIIKKYIINGVEILNKSGLEGDHIPGDYIPIVLLKGREYNIEGKRHIKGLIRDAKDPQRLVDYWITATADTIALAPKSEWLGTGEQFEGYENDFLEANNKNLPMLKYNPHIFQGQLVPPPQRVSPAQAPTALFEQVNLAQEQLKAVIGMKNIDLKDNGRELSGIAQARKQRPADLSTFVYHDNLARGIIHGAKIMNSMIPEVYDSERDIRSRNYDDSQSFVPINTTIENALKKIQENPERYSAIGKEEVVKLKRQIALGQGGEKYNDIGVGKYGLVMSTTPSYATQRQESTDLLGKLIQTNPKLMSIFGDIFVRGLDVLYSEEIAQRMQKMLPPGLVPPKEGEPPPTPLPPSPQVSALMEKAKAATIGAQVKIKELAIKEQELKIKGLQLVKEIQESKGGIRKEVLDILTQVMSPQALNVIGNQGTPQGQPPQNMQAQNMPETE